MSSEEDWKALFDQWDSDGSGVIKRKELYDVLMKQYNDHEKTIETMSTIFGSADKDADGTITWDEFKEALANM
jgi:Ca2+-binding EF-hand superfamily protein